MTAVELVGPDAMRAVAEDSTFGASVDLATGRVAPVVRHEAETSGVEVRGDESG